MFASKPLRVRVATLALAMLAPAGSLAQHAWPVKPVRVAIGNSAGSTPDVVARVFAEGMTASLGQPMLVENRPGADGVIAANTVARATPDGYTLLIGTQQTFAVAPHTRKALPFDPLRDFIPISMVIDTTQGNALAVHQSYPVRTIGELIAYAREHPNKLTYSTTVATASLFMEWFKRRAGVQMREVRYKDAPLAVQDALGGRVSVAVNSPFALQHGIKAGTLRLLVTATSERIEGWGDVPTVQEVFPDYGFVSFVALFGPAGLPKAIVERLNRDTEAALKSPAFAKMTHQVMWYNREGARTPEALAKLVRGQFEYYAQLTRDLGIKPQ